MNEGLYDYRIELPEAFFLQLLQYQIRRLCLSVGFPNVMAWKISATATIFGVEMNLAAIQPKRIA